MNQNSIILLIHCPDQKGIVTSVTEFIFKNNGNVIHLHQHVDVKDKHFFMRIECDVEKLSIPQNRIGEYFDSEIAKPFNMQWNLYFSQEVQRMALFVSKQSHCLYDVLSRWKSNEINVEIPLIVSNHPEMQVVAQQFGIDFHCFKISSENRFENRFENKAEQELKQLALLQQYNIDFIVLARYMQILSTKFVEQYPNRIINIHHSFLPAFPGAKPYHLAHERGVKVIGATSHYVTSDLDAGPIIAQDVIRISHVDTVDDLVRKGRNLEKIVLSEAIWCHLQRKTLVCNNRTIVFD